MKQATITISDELDKAIERYRKGFEDPPELDILVQRALETYLTLRGFVPGGTPTGRTEGIGYVPSRGGKPKPLENAPVLDAEHSVARAVIEDRR